MANAFHARVRRAISGTGFRHGVIEKFNTDFLKAILAVRPRIAWIEKALLLLPETLSVARQKLPDCRFVCWQEDDPFGLRAEERGFWSNFIESIPLYDLHFVKRVANITEFARHGGKRIEIFMGGFFRPLFHPISASSVPAALRHDVSFVGTALDHRVGVVSELLLKHHVNLHVYGSRWNQNLVYFRRRASFHPAALAEDYVQVIAGSCISLGFVSSSNRDEYTMRSFEIPAVGGFFLGERTPAHLQLYQEGKEAEFFDSTDECAEKINFYLRNEPARRSIAHAGYERCLDSDYSLRSRMREAIRLVESL